MSDALGIDYVEEPEPDNDKAWDKVRREIMDGRPAVICVDIFYMDHRDYKVHFPFNRFVMMGFDDEIRKAYIHDRVSLDLQQVSYQALALSRNPPDYLIFNTWGRFRTGCVRRSLEEACLGALKKSARRMTGADDHQRRFVSSLIESALSEKGAGHGETGLDGLKMFRNELPTWRGREETAWIASYASRTIEVFGTGGGNFRKMYAAFPSEARAMVPDVVDEGMPVLAEKSANLWTSLSQSLNRIAEGEAEESWNKSVGLIDQIAAVENDLFCSMPEKFPE